MRRAWTTLAAVALAASLLTCARNGFQPSGSGLLAFDSTAETPFGDVSVDGIMIAEVARLEFTPGVAALPAMLPSPLAGAAAAAVGEVVLVSGGSLDRLDGFPTACNSDLVAYDLGQGTLDTAGRLPNTAQGHALIARPNGELFSVMGCCNSSAAQEERVHHRQPGAASFAQLGVFPTYGYNIAAGVHRAADGDRVIVAGGRGSGPLRDALQTLALDTGAISQWPARLPSPRCLAAGAMVGDTFFVIGGDTESSCTVAATDSRDLTLDEIVAVDAVGQSATVVGHLPDGLAGACAVTRPDGEVLIFGGFGYEPPATTGPWTRVVSSQIYALDPVTYAVSVYPQPLPAPRAGMACAQTASGRIVLAGGIDETGLATDSLWLFEPYVSSGTLTSAVNDAGVPGARWTMAQVDAVLPDDTALTLELRTGHRQRDLADIAWLVVDPTQPLPDELRRGRYLQWRITLSSTNAAVTPSLRAVRLAYTSE